MMNPYIRFMTLDQPRAAREMLIERFSASPLRYHNLDHIMFMLDLYERYFMDDMTPDADRLLRLAIWWHDEFYDPEGQDNEARSADRALEVLNLNSMDSDTLRDLIMATKGHVAKDDLEQILIDLDLAILATPRKKYRSYAATIRLEYSMYSDEDFRKGRLHALRGLRDATPLLETLSEARGLDPHALGDAARANIDWEIHMVDNVVLDVINKKDGCTTFTWAGALSVGSVHDPVGDGFD